MSFILVTDTSPGIENILIKDYEGKPFLGISSMFYNSKDNLIYFTDSGKFEFGQCYPENGSLYCLDLETKILKPILYECLSYPNDVVYDYLNKIIYVCEPFSNKILRVKTSLSGVKYTSVFHQFTGRLGPSNMVVDDAGNLYVARFEFSETIENSIIDGLISVLNPNGVLIGQITLPRIPEISGLFIPSKKKDNLYFTERGTTCVMKIKLSNFYSELDKLENKKFFSSINS